MLFIFQTEEYLLIFLFHIGFITLFFISRYADDRIGCYSPDIKWQNISDYFLWYNSIMLKYLYVAWCHMATWNVVNIVQVMLCCLNALHNYLTTVGILSIMLLKHISVKFHLFLALSHRNDVCKMMDILCRLQWLLWLTLLKNLTQV